VCVCLYNALALTEQLAALSNARSEAQRYTVERQLMTGGIISRENLINQSASKQRPVLPFLSFFLCAHLPPAAVSSGTVHDHSHCYITVLVMHASTLSQSERLLHSIAALLGRMLSAAAWSFSLAEASCSDSAASGSW